MGTGRDTWVYAEQRRGRLARVSLELLTKGAGIPQDSLPARVIYRSDKDQRHYLMQEIRKAGIMDPKPNHNWRFVPETWVKAAAARDRELLFGKQ